MAYLDDCDNCQNRISGLCRIHAPGQGESACDTAYHYLGSSPREFPNASRGDPAVLCGICFRLQRGHRGAALEERAGW
jgi:hypothetical protein